RIKMDWDCPQPLNSGYCSCHPTSSGVTSRRGPIRAALATGISDAVPQIPVEELDAYLPVPQQPATLQIPQPRPIS
ncbi:hypothetical protein, partial [Corynebacterium amycolatum]|uniref:hypothetical protein n=1 Tax=Corynebacterium amycolatum TaxID=43765 RepID=UPI001CD24545